MLVRVFAIASLFLCVASASLTFDAMIAINYANPIKAWSSRSDCSSSISSSSFMGVNCTTVRSLRVFLPSSPPLLILPSCRLSVTRWHFAPLNTTHSDFFRLHLPQQRNYATQHHDERQAPASDQARATPLFAPLLIIRLASLILDSNRSKSPLTPPAALIPPATLTSRRIR